jgi:hypothetical protein
MKPRVCFIHSKIDKGEGWITVANLIDAIDSVGDVCYIEDCPRCWKEKLEAKVEERLNWQRRTYAKQ